MALDPYFWSRLVMTLGLEAASVVAIVWIATRFLRSASMCRFVWRTAIVCLLLLCASDLSGLGLIVADGFSQREEGPAKRPVLLRKVVERAHPVAAAPFSVQTLDEPTATWWPGIIWGLGCAAVLVRLVTAHGLLFVLRRMRKRVSEEAVIAEAKRTAALMGIRRDIALIEAREVASPFAFGIFRPVIALPEAFSTKFQSQEREAILAHETAHVAANDPAWQLIANVVSALFWWHPAVWLARGWLYDAAEMAADEAVTTLEHGPETLAGCLVSMARSVVSPLWWGGVGMNGTERRSNLRRRVERLLKLPKTCALATSARQRAIRLAAAALFVFSAFLLSGFVQEQSVLSDGAATWKGSPVAVMWNQVTKRIPHPALMVPTMIANAKRLYEAGRLAEASNLLQMALKLEPENKAARYYLDLVREAGRRGTEWNQPWLLPTLPPKVARVSGQAPVVVMPAPKAAPIANRSSADGTNLYSKTFHLDPRTLTQTLKEEGYAVSDPKIIHERLRDWLKSKGIDLSDPRKSIFYKDRTGLLLVRGTLSDLEYVELAVQTMGKVQSQLVLETRIAEIGGDADNVLKRLGVDLKRPQTWISESERDLTRALDAEPGVNILRAPKVTTLSERTAYVETTDELADGRKRGVAVTLMPKISADDYSIELTAIFARGTTKDKNSRLPQAGTAHATVSDRGTLVFVCDDPEAKSTKDLVMVTATVIDPAGNAIHTDEQVEARKAGR